MAVLAIAILPNLMAAQEPVLEASARATLEEVVRFDFDQATLSSEAEQLLRAKLPILNESAGVVLLLEGRADERGSIEYNLALGGRRAESVRDFLVGLGISADRLTTTSFGEERPLVSGSDAAAWAQNRRVEFMISGVSEGMVAGGVEPPPAAGVEPTPIGGDAVALDVDRPDPGLVQGPGVVGGVAVVTPDEAPAQLVRSRPNLERDRRSRFYGAPTTPTANASAGQADYLWVSRSSTWSAEWLGAEEIESVEFDGLVESFVVEGELRTALPYIRVRLTLNPGFRVRLGDALQVFRPARVNPELGVIQRPQGVVFVTRVTPTVVEAVVLEVCGRVRVGDYVRPAPVHDLESGEYPESVTNRSEGTVIEFGDVHQLYGLRKMTILDQGARDGVDIGDEYVSFFGDGSTEEVTGRVRVVLVEDETSSAEIVNVLGPVFKTGTTVHLDRKMR
jgi:peptidoglycan-associated lipoprotein